MLLVWVPYTVFFIYESVTNSANLLTALPNTLPSAALWPLLRRRCHTKIASALSHGLHGDVRQFAVHPAAGRILTSFRAHLQPTRQRPFNGQLISRASLYAQSQYQLQHDVGSLELCFQTEMCNKPCILFSVCSLSPLHKQTISEVLPFDPPTISEEFVELEPPGTIRTAENPPALPPKRNRNTSKPTSCSETPPVSPKFSQTSQPNSNCQHQQPSSILHQAIEQSLLNNHVASSQLPASAKPQQQQPPAPSSLSPNRQDIRVTVNNALPVNVASADDGYIQMSDVTMVKEKLNKILANGRGGPTTTTNAPPNNCAKSVSKDVRSAKSISQVGNEDGAADDEDGEETVVLRNNQQVWITALIFLLTGFLLSALFVSIFFAIYFSAAYIYFLHVNMIDSFTNTQLCCLKCWA